jgi:phosphatidylglycerol:prolipoprotein diacylglycerol transferase
MYPVLFRIGSFEITSFGLLVGIAAIVGVWLFEREARRDGFAVGAVDAATAGVLGGLAGAKLLGSIEFHDTAPILTQIFSRGGLSWFGGLIGGVTCGLWMLRRRGVPLLTGLSAATPALAVGHAIGRVGCFLVGDDYGRPTNLPWGVAFPEGLPPIDVPVHPTQLYEAALLIPVALVLMRQRRRGARPAAVVGLYLVLAGTLRFAIEFVRVNFPVLGPFTLAQVIAATLTCVGVFLLTRRPSAR